MNIPKAVKILWKNYEVEEVSNLHDNDGGLYGQIEYQRQKICINSASLPSQRKATLLHEVIHGIDELFKIGLEERQVEKLGSALYQFICDNPEIFREDEK